MTARAPNIDTVDVAAYTFPTTTTEADGTLEWDSVTAVVVTMSAGGHTGSGWTYTSPVTARIVEEHLVPVVREFTAFDSAAGWTAMHRAGRNLGTRGLYLHAMSAVDVAWWDLKAKLLDTSVTALAGGACTEVALYGSGGFTTLSDGELADQVAGWHAVGARAMKIKIGESWGRCIERDLARVRQLAQLAGPDVAVMVDANGGYDRGQALRVGRALDDLGVVWFEEPVSSDDIDGLTALSRQLDCDVTAGEYAADAADVTALLPAVDCLQLDATRCGGYTGFLRNAAHAAAQQLDVSAHCAPALHAPIAAAVPNLRHVEYFVDHVRVEDALLDGVAVAADGRLAPQVQQAGHGMVVAESAADHLCR